MGAMGDKTRISYRLLENFKPGKVIDYNKNLTTMSLFKLVPNGFLYTAQSDTGPFKHGSKN